jgi:heptosyltransferase-2
MDHWSYLKESAQNKPIIGLNTGAGSRWPTRLWPEENWKQLIVALKNAGYAPLLLGGNDEHERNSALKQETGAMYEGVFPLETFIAISAQCDVIVTAVSMTMHIALGLGKKMVLFNNIFNKHEFDVFGRGEIIEPETGCDCYYGARCSRDRICMKDISVNTVFAAIQRQIS